MTRKLLTVLLLTFFWLHVSCSSPKWVSTSANFPIVESNPNLTPTPITLTQGSHYSFINISSLNPITQIKICIQRNLSPPKDVTSWPSCTFYYSYNSTKDKSSFSFEVSDVEGNIPYFINIIIAGRQIETTSVLVLWSVRVCEVSFIESIDDPNLCTQYQTLKNENENIFFLKTNTQYFSTFLTPSNENLIVELTIELDLEDFSIYASPNMAPTLKNYYFYYNSSIEKSLTKNSLIKIKNPSSGIWYFCIIAGSNYRNKDSITITVKLSKQNSMSIGQYIPDNGDMIIGPELDDPNQLTLYHFNGLHGSIQLSLSVYYPEYINDEVLPYLLFVSKNSIPGSFTSIVDHSGDNVYADWKGSSTKPLEEKFQTIRLPAIPNSANKITFIVGILALGNNTGQKYVLWRNSLCPSCERGTCSPTLDPYGSCKCPPGWISINCQEWAKNTLMPQIIVMITLLCLFFLILIIYTLYIVYDRINNKSLKKIDYGSLDETKIN